MPYEIKTKVELSEKEFQIIKDYRNGFRWHAWSVADFIKMAEQAGAPERYCFDDFQYLLQDMIDYHDSNEGINWETVKYWLKEAEIVTNGRAIVTVLVPMVCIPRLIGDGSNDDLSDKEILAVGEFEKNYTDFSPVYSTYGNYDKHFSLCNDVSRIFLACDVVTLRCFERENHE